ncbi:acyl-ACP--UDP-N-acetylglucosamine O-acyltransferase [Simiduia curdlanivorans]|uniref:Acyl-[acyl-carrier-protein]--UDP-N-acetylglucosamine O-acyltransferase n=1 Tax=Simiduia curdlanivorans TaxID=1492769 RepID=A0ABV8UYK5_9GAMM|nr:acyl-ACP--UDP-N-acetylglucosamine O-acyltransferase [Simiduia curdlanivorans]MDN3640382.1 acyl-ACP--UDP-N-acetylglucosamine O-acyltransferase [Simiduia curdlanivorans]
MIDPRAVIDPTAKLAADVQVGPFSVIGPNVEIGAGSIVESHVVIKGPTSIGENNHIFQFSTVGESTPDLKYKGEPTRLVIGNNNVIREGVTIHRGTVQDRSETTIGDDNLLMAYVHVGHDSIVGNNCVLVNNAALAGHVHIGDWAILGGYTLVHQFCKIGAHAFTAMGSAIGKDVPAFVTVSGNPAEAKSINTEGLRRRGYTKDQLAAINKAFKLIYRRGLRLEEALSILSEMAIAEPALITLIDSLRSSERGIVR